MESDKQRDFIAQVAKLAEYTERYEDMSKFMKQLVELSDGTISNEERNLLSLAYKQVLSSLRNAHRSICTIETGIGGGPEKQAAIDYRVQIEKEVCDTCREIIGLLDAHLLEKADEPEAKVFYLKMKADYYRYLAEVADGGSEEKKQVVEHSRKAYQDAFDIASQHLGSANPIRLGLSLNFSVFHYEIAHVPHEAIQLAKQAFDEASAQMEEMSEESYKDGAVIMQLLRDNLDLWTSIDAQGMQDKQPEANLVLELGDAEQEAAKLDDEKLEKIEEVKHSEPDVVNPEEEGRATAEGK